ncbi:hypothetical protein E1265_31245 [Streptomyces sp. 8K308]|uniref:hypothetical protein n=1 Tax=Streptomyces sp. 8K308 TaxID=2530388 RepID=UPI00104B0372|nr:hypothetical protein [Streptomyces sp. 8K308]TDC10410.1 hypothetical protein E1265_31245 [Streptomyces sp. 8K308]
MTSETDNNDRGPKSSAAGAWAVGGLAAGVILLARYQNAVNMADRDATIEEAGIMICLIFFPMYAFYQIGKQLVREVEKGNSTWATFWTTTVGVFVAVFTLLGVTSVDDLSTLGS